MNPKNDPHSAGRESVAEGLAQLHSVDEARRLLGGMGRTWFYAEVAAKRIRVVKLGARTLVPASEVRRVIAEAEAKAADAVTVLSAKTFDQGITRRYAMEDSA